MNTPRIAMMMAMDRNRLIGKNGGLPWHVPGELAYFKSTTMGKPVIMGRKTFDSIGKPLPGRPNIVVTRNAEWQHEGAYAARSLQNALELGEALCDHVPEPASEMVVIGGAALCQEAMPVTQRLYLTVIDHEFDGDTWLESFQWNHWLALSEDVRDPATTGGLNVTYWVLERDPDTTAKTSSA